MDGVRAAARAVDAEMEAGGGGVGVDGRGGRGRRDKIMMWKGKHRK